MHNPKLPNIWMVLLPTVNQVDTMLYSISIWVLYSLSQPPSKSWNWLHCSPSSTLATISSDFLVLLLSPLIIIHILFIITQDSYLIIQRILPLMLSFDIVPLNPLAPKFTTRLSAGTQIPTTWQLAHVDYIIKCHIQASIWNKHILAVSTIKY